MKKSIVLILLTTFISISCSTDKTETDAEFVHTVFFWMKPGTGSEEKASFEEGLEKLGTVPVILSYEYGIPAGTSREVVDNSYDYAWIVRFRTREDQDSYQEDLIHLEFVEKYGHLWEKVIVYDTILK
jgi:hypothetical protein